MKAIYPFLFISLLFVVGQSCTTTPTKNLPKGNFLGASLPIDTPAIFGKGFISTQHNNRDITFSPDMSEIYFTTTNQKSTFSAILMMKQEHGTWSKPEIAPFSGQYSDIEPMFSPDGQSLFFVSKRPLEGKGEPKDWDIWKAERTQTGWSDPINLGEPVNTSKDEFYPSLAANGNLYFTAQYDTLTKGKEDIYRTELTDNGYQKPENIGDSVNTQYYEFNAFIAPDESYLIYTSYGRPDGIGGGDLYITYKDSEGDWGKTVLFPFNSKALDYCPSVSPDGKAFFFTSQKTNYSTHFDLPLTANGFNELLSTDGGNIYWLDADRWINQ